MFTSSCEREQRIVRPAPPLAETVRWTALSPLVPGDTGNSLPAGNTIPPSPLSNNYEENSYALAEGKRLYSAYNCVGCHAQGGGGMGPALMDSKWIYGSEPDQIFSTIVQGRPNGMPSFGTRLPAYQIWQVAAYVRSMSGRVSSQAAPGRNDEMKGAPPENTREQPPPGTGVPKSAEMPP